MARLRISIPRMARSITIISTFLLLFIGSYSPDATLCAQAPNELRKYDPATDTIHSQPIRRPIPVTRINTVRPRVDRVSTSGQDPRKKDTQATPSTPDTATFVKPFIPDKERDPRAKLDSVLSAPDETPNGNIIYLERTDVMSFDKDALPNKQILSGNVLFRHDDALLYCDSAHLDQTTNSFEAFGHVHIDQGDSVQIYSRLLKYDGNTRMAYLWHNVRLINGEVTITTDTLTYDRNRNLGFYLCGGTVQDSVNTLISDHGYYYSNTKDAEFKSNVFGYNDDNTIESDTLRYNTNTKVATILGPTLITHLSDTSTIYSELGWYDTERDLAQLLENSLITYSEGRTLRGDTIFYDKASGRGEAFYNVVITDSINDMILTGHYGYYSEDHDQCLMTDSALMRQFSEGDTIYIHGDTIYAYELPDTSKIVHLYHNSRLYAKDFQAIADSIYYTSIDSTTHLRLLPVLWNDDWQITGDSINVYPTEGELNRARVMDNAMIIQSHDTIHYNQMSGKEMLAFIGDEALDSLQILGNAESIFFPNDDDKLIGLNKIKSSYMNIYFNNGKLDRIKVFPSPEANMIPMAMVLEEMLRMPNFTWQQDARPTDPTDVFRRPERITVAEIASQKEELKQQQKDERRKNRKEALEKETATNNNTNPENVNNKTSNGATSPTNNTNQATTSTLPRQGKGSTTLSRDATTAEVKDTNIAPKKIKK